MSRRDAVERLLTWSDTAVIEDAATILVLENSFESIALVCEALASKEASADPEVQDTILGVLSPAWKSGAIDLPSLLRTVHGGGTEQARTGAALAMEWLGIDR